MRLSEFHLFDVGQWFVALNEFKPEIHKGGVTVKEGELVWFDGITLSRNGTEGFRLLPWGKGGKPDESQIFLVTQEEMKGYFVPTADQRQDDDVRVGSTLYDVDLVPEMPGEQVPLGDLDETLLRNLIREEVVSWNVWQRRPRNSNIPDASGALDDVRRDMHASAFESDLTPAADKASKAIKIAKNEDELIAALEDNGFPIDSVVSDGTIFSGLDIESARDRMEQQLRAWIGEVARNLDDDPGLPLFIGGED